MTNPYHHGSSGSFPPPYTSSPGSGSTMARRSSYASVLSGAASASSPANPQPIRSGSQQPSNPAHTASSPTQSQAQHLRNLSHPNPRTADYPHSYSGTQQFPSDSWDKSHLPRRSSSFSQWPDGPSTSTMDTRHTDFFVPSYMRGLRHVEKLEEKFKARISSHRDPRSGRSSNAGSLSTSASGLNLHKMVPSHRGMTYEIQEKRAPSSEETLSPLPTRWSPTDKCPGLELSLDGLEVKFTGTIKAQDEAPAIRADHPMPRECGIYYFEVTLLGKGKENLVGIGFSGPKAALNRIPGWEPESWAYHGDDGFIFNQNSTSGKAYGPSFGHLDVIGCGVNFKTGTTFFTKNGHNLGTAFRDMRSDKLFPAVGMKKPGEHVKVNFGQTPFVYDIDSKVARERAMLQFEIAQEDPSHLHSQRNETLLLQELIAQYLAQDGYVESAKAFSDEVKAASALLQGSGSTAKIPEYTEDLNAIHRQQIRAAILEGDVDSALKHTRAYYPTVLTENENIYFKLRCRKFIEMIKRSTDLQPRSKRPSSNSTYHSKTYSNGHEPKYVHDEFDVFDARMDMDGHTNGTSGTAIEEVDDDGMDMDGADVFARQSNLMNDALQYGRELQAEFKDDPRREVKQALEDTFALIAYPDARESSLAPLLENSGRVPVAEELNSAILVSLGQSSSTAIERLIQQTEALVDEISSEGGGAALINTTKQYVR